MFEAFAVKAVNLYMKRYKIFEYLGHSDKLVYKVESCSGELYILSLYFPKGGIEYYKENAGLYSRHHIQAETDLLLMLSEKTDLSTSCPIKNLAGEYISFIDIDGYPESIAITLSTFIEGLPMDDKSEDYPAQAYSAGIATAKLHDFSSTLPDASSFGFPERGEG